MKNSIKIYHPFCLLLVMFLSINTFSCLAQNSNAETKDLNTAEIEDLIELAKYDKTVKRLVSKNKNQREKYGQEGSDGEKLDGKLEPESDESIDFSLNASPLLSGLFYIIIIVLVLIIVITIFSSIKVDKKIKLDEKIKATEIEDIEIIDAKSGLELALLANDYRTAVRMLFIQLLQVLVIENSIKWRSEKTNRHYLAEMNLHPKIHHFGNLVMAYERVWYGSEEIDKTFFEYLRMDFDKFYATDKVKINVQK